MAPSASIFERYGRGASAMSMARLWRDQGKRDEARELLAPNLLLVYRRV
jgi:hypothetical protein